MQARDDTKVRVAQPGDRRAWKQVAIVFVGLLTGIAFGCLPRLAPEQTAGIGEPGSTAEQVAGAWAEVEGQLRPRATPIRDEDPMRIGVWLTVAERVPEWAEREAAPLAATAGQALSDAAVAAVLGRVALPAVPETPAPEIAGGGLAGAQAAAVVDSPFSFPPGTLPAPRPGATTRQVLSSVGGEPVAPAGALAGLPGPLRVLSYGPEGEVAATSQVSIVFSKPMVALTGVAEQPVPPVRLTPALPGGWRWLNPQTLVFEVAGGLPPATRFQVELPAGLVSAVGDTLADALSWSFSTTPPVLASVRLINRLTEPGQFLLATFDQRIAPEAALEHLRLEVGDVALRLMPLPAAELEDRRMTNIASAMRQGRSLALVTEQALPGSADAVLRLLPGMPSLEGPLTTTTEQTHSLRTRDDFVVLEHGCGPLGRCSPELPWTIEFSQRPALLDSTVWIEPALPDARVRLAGRRSLVIAGRPQAGVTYRVMLAPHLHDGIGNPLGDTEPLEFEIGPSRTMEPVVWAPGFGLVAVPPDGPVSYPVLASGLDAVEIAIRAVEPTEWPAFMNRPKDPDRQMVPLDKLPGRELWREVLPVEGAAHEAGGGAAGAGSAGDAGNTGSGDGRGHGEVLAGSPGVALVELDSALDASGGHVILAVMPAGAEPGTEAGASAVVWIQRAGTALHVMHDAEEIAILATSLDGSPAPDVEILKLRSGASLAEATVAARTDEYGMARIAADSWWHPGMILSREAGQVSVHPGELSQVAHRLGRIGFGDSAVRAHIFTDRPIYQPGELVRFAGWLRTQPGKGGDLTSAVPLEQLHVRVAGPRGEPIYQDTLQVREGGWIEGGFQLPAEVNAGNAWIRMPDLGMFGNRAIQIQEFRRPAFDMLLLADPGPHVVGGTVELEARATYLTGGGLPDAEIQWLLSNLPATWTPPNADGFIFRPAGTHSGTLPAMNHSGRTDAEGRHHLLLELDSLASPRPVTIRVQATVTDVDRQSRNAPATLLVHPADVYVGMRPAARRVRTGEPLLVETLVVDLEGEPVTGRPVIVEVIRQEQSLEAGRPRIRDGSAQSCSVRSAQDGVNCSFHDLAAGEYRLVARVSDTAGRENASETVVHVTSRQGRIVPRTGGGLALVPDRESYLPGDTAILLVQGELPGGHGLLTMRREGLVDLLPVRLNSATRTIRLPITERHVPNIHLRLVVNGPDGLTATANLPLQVPPETRRLAVDVEPRTAIAAPGASTAATVAVRDAGGRPVSDAQVTLIGLDEALSALASRRDRDPIETLYRSQPLGVTDFHSMQGRLAPKPFSVTGETGALTGKVTALETGAPISGALIKLHGTTRTTVTTADGTYAFTALPPDTYTLVMHETVLHEGVVVERGAITSKYSTPSVITVQSSGRSVHEVAVPTPELRTDFSPVAVFELHARTGPDGRAEIPIELPHNLSRYRLRAVVAAGETHFGSGEATLTARLPLMIRATPPRFLNQQDSFELSATVENRTGEDLPVDVAVSATGATLTGNAGRRITVPANDRVELRFPAQAPDRPGTARFQLAVLPVVANGPVGGGAHERAGGADSAWLGDAMEVTIPVLPPSLVETVAVYGELADDGAVAYPLVFPADARPTQSRFEVGFSTTAAHGLTDALDVLAALTCGFAGPTAARLLALSALRATPSGAEPAGATPAGADGSGSGKLERLAEEDVLTLTRLQITNGGFGVFPVDRGADPFTSTLAAHALQRAAQAGFAVPDWVLERSRQYLHRLEDPQAGRRPDASPIRPDRAAAAWHTDHTWEYPDLARLATRAYALHVRHLMGDTVAATAAALLHDAGPARLPAEALAWLLAPLAGGGGATAEDAELVRRQIQARIVRSAGTAGVVSPYAAGARHVLYSPRRTDAVVLEALLADGSPPDLATALARGLLAHRVAGRWANSLENAFAVLALHDYLAAFETVEPALTARAWIGGKLAGQHDMDGRSEEQHQLLIPLDSLLPLVSDPLTPLEVAIAREGDGRLYYRLGLSYVLADLTPPALTRGFKVVRSYQAIDDPADVQRDEDGTWRIRLGARVLVRLEVAAAGPRYHVALADPLPAGLEAVNFALRGAAGPATLPAAEAASPDRATGEAADLPRFPLRHVNVRSDRFEAFTLRLNAGRFVHTYLALATTPGRFTAPPTRVEETYAPETLGRGPGHIVVVEERGAERAHGQPAVASPERSVSHR